MLPRVVHDARAAYLQLLAAVLWERHGRSLSRFGRDDLIVLERG